jgi:hypothetical protein
MFCLVGGRGYGWMVGVHPSYTSNTRSYRLGRRMEKSKAEIALLPGRAAHASPPAGRVAPRCSRPCLRPRCSRPCLRPRCAPPPSASRRVPATDLPVAGHAASRRRPRARAFLAPASLPMAPLLGRPSRRRDAQVSRSLL